MSISVVISTCGSDDWCDLAWSRAYPSVDRQRIAGIEIVVEHHPDLSIAGARNAAARSASCDWLCFLDADDELGPGYLAAMERAWRATLPSSVRDAGPRYAPALLVPAVSFVEPAADWDTWLKADQRRDYQAFRYSEPAIPNGGGTRPLIDINHAVIGTLVPRRLFLEAGGFRELPALEDWDLWLRCEEAGAKLVPVRDAVYLAWVRPGSRNADQSLYTTLRSEALARRSSIRGRGRRDASRSTGDGDGHPGG